MNGAESGKAPWHLWAVGILTLLWNGSGTYTFVMAQLGMLSGLSAEQVAYYAAQPMWAVVSTDTALFCAVAAGFALLLRRRAALWLFAISLIAILLSNAYELLAGVSRMLVSQDAIILTVTVVIIATLQLVYSWAMSRRGVLK